MRGIFKYLEFISHEILQNLMAVYLLLPNDLDSAFNFRLSMQGNPYLSEASFSQHSSYFVPVFDVLHVFQPFKILKTQNIFSFLIRGHGVIFCRKFQRIFDFTVLLKIIFDLLMSEPLAETRLKLRTFFLKLK